MRVLTRDRMPTRGVESHLQRVRDCFSRISPDSKTVSKYLQVTEAS